MEYLTHLIDLLFAWVQANPHSAGLAIFLISMTESLVIIGLFVPGVAMMSMVGSLVGAGVLSPIPTLLWAILGAVVGDGVSYKIGYYYRHSIRESWIFHRMPHLMSRGENFFAKHGGKSVFLGRFIGVIRPVIPVVAGMMEMSSYKFFLANISSAMLWAPIYCLPGYLVGMSVNDFPAGVGKNLLILLFLFFTALWLLSLIIRKIFAVLIHLFHNLNLIIWHKIETSNRKTIKWLFSSSHKSIPHQLGICELILFLSLIFCIFTYSVIHSGLVTIANSYSHELIRSLYNTNWAYFWAIITVCFGKIPVVFGLFCIIIAFWLQKNRYYAGIIFACSTFSLLILYAIKQGISYPRPQDVELLRAFGSYPSGHTFRALFMSGMFAVLYDLHHNYRRNITLYIVPCLIFFLVAFSRMYLGAHWLTDVIGAGIFAWISLSILKFSLLRFHANNKQLKIAMISGFIAFIIGCVWNINYKLHKELSFSQPLIHKKIITYNQWWYANNKISMFRAGLLSDHEPLLNVQWQENKHNIEKKLSNNHWIKLAKFNVINSLSMLATKPELKQIPLTPIFHLEHRPQIEYAKIINNNKLLVIRMWPSQYQVTNHGMLWVGTLEFRYLRKFFIINYLAKNGNKDYVQAVYYWQKHKLLPLNKYLIVERSIYENNHIKEIPILLIK